MGKPGLDDFLSLLGEVSNVWARRRPPLPFDLARGLAVLRDGPCATGADDLLGYPVTLGIPMAEVASALST